MYKLFESSWRDDAVVLDKGRGIYTDPSRVRKINHKGKYYSVPGPHICQPSPQRTPLLLQAGTSRAGKAFAAQHAEVIFVAGLTPGVVAGNIADIRSMAEKDFGRKKDDLKFLAMICPIIAETEEAAKAKYDDYVKYIDMEGIMALFGGWTGVDMSAYGDDDELKNVESNAIR
jgi:alkanesulfonate monooxygenase SsuD/methylene tetrahydromethanopterin reductase-like flavin-dependent oxidoreductase (luciferase family)